MNGERILLFGADGQVGWELRRALQPLGGVHALARGDLDLTREEELAARVRSLAPTLIVNAAAYTAVDQAESDETGARTLNATVPAILAREAGLLRALLVHYSTDYVFDGRKSGAYTEADATRPLSAYGRTKLEGDQSIAAADAAYLTLRVSWVFSVRGRNFMRSILKLGRERAELRVVADQVGAPTSAEYIADVTAHAVAAHRRRQLASGVYHFASAGETSWCAYARFIVAEAKAMGAPMKLTPDAIAEITSDEYGAAAPRPRNSRLDSSRLCRALETEPVAWEIQVRRALAEVLERG